MKKTAAILLALSIAGGVGLTGCGRGSKASVYTGVLEGKSVQVPALTGGKVVSLLVDTVTVSAADVPVLPAASTALA